MEIVKSEIKVFDNFIQITPTDGVKDNSTYEIRLKNLKQLGGKRTLENQTVSVTTAMTPAYTTLQAVESLIASCNIPRQTILYHIREASKFVDYIKGSTQQTIPFEVEQFVKYKAAHECVLRYYIDRTSEAGVKGTLGDVSFDTSSRQQDITELLKGLKAEVSEWQDAVRGFKNPGRAAPASAVKGGYIQNARQITDTPPTRTLF